MASRQFKFTSKSISDTIRVQLELPNEIVELDSDSENDEAKVVRTVSPVAENGKAAWKGLMNRMQQNQRTQALTGSKAIKKGVKRGLGLTQPSARGKFPYTSSENSLSKRPKLFCNSETLASLVPESKATHHDQTTERPACSTKWIPGTLKVVSAEEDHGNSECKHTTGRQEDWSLLFNEEDLSTLAGWSGERTEVNLNEVGNETRRNADTETKTTKKAPRPCPFYKKIPGTSFSVDAFNYGEIPGIQVHFLSHFHSDHYIGLTKSFSKTIICDPATGNLINMKLGVSENCIRRLELNRIYVIQGTEVVLINANHCPGSVMFLLRLPNRTTILHTGDFRFTPDMLINPFLNSLRVDCLYLDTTYCDPKYTFPSQSDSIAQVIGAVKRHISYRPKTLVICGAYCIGKERVFFTLAEAIKTKVFCAPDKRRIIRQLGNPKFDSYMSESEASADIHVLPMRTLHTTCLSEYLAHRSSRYTNIIAIKPTGWEFSRTGQGFSSKSFNKDTLTIIGVPYSEHSSFSELKDFVKALKPIKVQPTVNVGSEPKRTAMMEHINGWLSS